MDLKKLACYECDELPKEQKILKCLLGHIYCWECASEADNFCKCKCRLIERPNPLQDLLKINCKYESSGCTFNFPTKEKYYNEHIMECKFRRYQCILKTFKIVDCRWNDKQSKFEEHFKKCHIKNIGKIYNYCETDLIPLNPRAQNNDIYKRIRLINAFNKNFIFYYISNRIAKMISIIIFLVGIKKDSNKYGYNFTFLLPDNNNNGKHMQIKYSQLSCFTDVDDIEKMITNGNCVSLPYYVAKNYVENNEIRFKFRMTKIETNNK